jgi:hypothetical protein
MIGVHNSRRAAYATSESCTSNNRGENHMTKLNFCRCALFEYCMIRQIVQAMEQETLSRSYLAAEVHRLFRSIFHRCFIRTWGEKLEQRAYDSSGWSRGRLVDEFVFDHSFFGCLITTQRNQMKSTKTRKSKLSDFEKKLLRVQEN